MRATLVLLAAALALAGCGKKGAPSRPGPADQIIYPHQYPVPEKSSPGATRPAAAEPVPLSTLPGSTMPGSAMPGLEMSAPDPMGSGPTGSSGAGGAVQFQGSNGFGN